jgi:peroxiredoxin
MKKSMGGWVITTAMLLTLGVIYGLSTNPKSSGAAGEAETPASVAKPQSRQIAASSSTAAASVERQSLAPNNLLANAFEFLDLIPVGHAAPDFTAKTAYNKPFRFSSLKGHKNAVLVFYQGSFCPVCGKQLEDIQAHLADFKAQDAEIIAISADDTAHAMQSVGEHGLQFTVLPDADKTIIKRYGVANVGREGIAWPALYIVDKAGKVRLSYADSQGHRMQSEEILPTLSKISGKPIASKGL